jgi:hypothetical protein
LLIRHWYFDYFEVYFLLILIKKLRLKIACQSILSPSRTVTKFVPLPYKSLILLMLAPIYHVCDADLRFNDVFFRLFESDGNIDIELNLKAASLHL